MHNKPFWSPWKASPCHSSRSSLYDMFLYQADKGAIWSGGMVCDCKKFSLPVVTIVHQSGSLTPFYSRENSLGVAPIHWGTPVHSLTPGACSIQRHVTDIAHRPAFNSFISIRFPAQQLLSQWWTQGVSEAFQFTSAHLIWKKPNLPFKSQVGKSSVCCFLSCLAECHALVIKAESITWLISRWTY